MNNLVLSAYCTNVPRFSTWRRADAVVVVFIVAIALLAALGLGVVTYCIWKGMSFEYAVSLLPWYVKIGCRK